MGEARRRREHDRLVALAAFGVSSQLELGEQREVPAEFRLFHAGVNHTQKGDFIFDEKAAVMVMTAYTAQHQSVPLMGDYEHQSLSTPPIIADASATQFVPEVRRDAQGGPELWATQVQWTDEARERLAAGKYRLYSPAFVPDKDGRIAELINFGLTNLPASYEIAPLVAASATYEGDNMEETLKKLTEQLAAITKDRDEHKELCEKMKATIAKKLGGKSFDDWAKEEEAEPEHADDKGAAEEEKKELKALRSHVIAVTGKASITEAMGAISLAVTQSKEFVSLKAKLEDETAKAAETEFTTLIDASVKEGKLPPVMKESFVALKRELGTPKALVALKAFVPKEPIIQLRGEHEPVPMSAVDPMQMLIARNCAGQFGGEAAFKAAATKAQ